MEKNELVSKYRNPKDKYLVFVDENEARETTSNLQEYLQGVNIKAPYWEKMKVYYRYAIVQNVEFHLHQVLDEELNFKLQNVRLRSKLITVYKNNYIPYARHPSEKDVQGFPYANKEAVRVWMMLVKNKRNTLQRQTH